ncbi:Breast cancer 2, early onset [Apophysomyces ossiformis]|uniref:Breast cancer 2, early onset n=1 Tax=Apophysomyces ossiformis TaxID=679940 RepID=A0A8H7EK60_9FUNG|nr:Breast cancer 2, early onset [Apophysomyces ossiformis]
MGDIDQDPDEFSDDWENLSQSFRDQLLQNVTSIEFAANQLNSQHHDLKSRRFATDTPLGRKENFFQVYTETTPLRTAGPKSNARRALQEISNHCRDTHAKTFPNKGHEKQAKGEKAHEPTHKSIPPEISAAGVGEPVDEDDDMWIEFDVDLLPMVEDIEQKRSDERDVKRQRRDETATVNEMSSEQVEYNLSKFGGFVTAGSKKHLDTKSESRKKALALFKETEKKQETPNTNGASDSTLDKKSVTEGLTTALETTAKMNDTESDKRLKAEAPLEADACIVSDLCHHLPIHSTDDKYEPNPTKSLDGNFGSGKKQPGAVTPTPIDFKHENILSEYGGFVTGAARAPVVVSEEARKRAIALFSKERVESSIAAEKPARQFGPHKGQMVQAANDPSTSNTRLSNMNEPSIAPSHSRRPLSLPSKKNPQRKVSQPFKSPIVKSKYELTKAALRTGQSSSSVTQQRRACVFDLNWKPLGYSRHDLLQLGICEAIIEMTAEKAKSYTFDGWGSREAEKDMIEAGALSHLISQKWVENHYGWIIWKIACLIRSYPHQFSTRWNRSEILHQLLYRYEREINLGHRSVIKRIMEQDDIPSKHMVLAIADVIDQDSSNNLPPASAASSGSKYRLILTDGWYQIPARVDGRMERAIRARRLKVGHKLSITGAQLLGDRTAQSPLTASSDYILSISTNGCLPAPWDVKLGYQRKKLVIRSLSSLFEDGGTVTALDVIICRKYPMLYTEVLANGITITRTAREEELRQQSLYTTCPNDNSWIPKFTAADLDDSLVMSHTTGKVEADNQRSVSGHFKIRICDFSANSTRQFAPVCTLLISNANQLTHNDIVEGSRYRIFFVQPYSPKLRRFPGLYLRTTRTTRWEPMQIDTSLNVSAYEQRRIILCDNLSNVDRSLDIDMAVYVLYVSNAVEDKRLAGRKLWIQTLLVTDNSKSLCQVTLRMANRPLGNVKEQVIGFLNLRYDTYDSKFGVTHLLATDETEIIIKRSSMAHQQEALQRVRQWCESCPEEVATMHRRVAELMQL